MGEACVAHILFFWQDLGMKKKLMEIVKLKIVAYLLMVALLVQAVLWLEPEQLKQHIFLNFHEMAEMFVIHVLQESNVKVSYLAHDQSGVVEKIVDRVNHSSNVYSFVENNFSEENLIAYEPQNIANESEAASEGAEMQSGEFQMLAENEMNEPQTETQQPETKTEIQDQIVETFAPAFPMEQLQQFDFLVSNLYIVPKRAKVLPEDLDAKVLLGMDMSIEKDASVPQILIYHTHGSETFVDSTEDIKGTGIIAVGARLAQILSENYGYNVIHCTEIFDNVNGVLDRSKAYDYSRETVQQILTDNPTIQVIIDLHRDGVQEDVHLVTDINGKQTAQIMFFNGVSRSSATGDIAYLNNQYRSQNLSFSLQAKLEALAKYPDFTRKNYIDAYQYNLDLMPRAMLIESGAQTNTLQEELNAMEPLADILDGVLSGRSRNNLGI